MNKRIMAFTVMASMFALVLSVAGPVLAHEGEDHSSEVRAAQTEFTDQQKAELKARLEKRKNDQKLRLTTAQKTRLGDRCKASQGHLKSLEGRIKGIETSRERVYGNLTERLKDLSTKLKAQSVDTTQLDAQIASLEEQITAFKVELTEYKQAVSDLAAMDCQQDPESFKAALEEARTLRKTLRESSQNIKIYVKETIKPTLATIRAALAAQEPDDDNSEEAN